VFPPIVVEVEALAAVRILIFAQDFNISYIILEGDLKVEFLER